MSAAQRQKLDAMRRWAFIQRTTLLPNGRLLVEFSYLGIESRIVFGEQG